MTGPASRNNAGDLIQAYLDGSLSRRGAHALQDWLRGDPAHMRAFALQVHIHAMLCERALGMNAKQASGSAARTRKSFRAIWPVALAASLLMALGVFWLVSKTDRPISPATLALTELSGDTVVLRAGQTLAGHVGMTVGPGDEVRTGGRSVALLENPDTGKTVRVEADTTVSFRNYPDSIHLAGGMIGATLTRARSQTRVFTTPRARATVTGTRFELAAIPELTRLAVQEGEVELTDLRTGRSVAVPAGHHAMVVSGASPRAVPLGNEIPSDYFWDFSEPPDPNTFKVYRGEWRHVPEAQCMETSAGLWWALINVPLSALPARVEIDVAVAIDRSIKENQRFSLGSFFFDKGNECIILDLRNPEAFPTINYSVRSPWSHAVTTHAYITESAIIRAQGQNVGTVLFYDETARGSRLVFSLPVTGKRPLRIHRLAIRSVRPEDVPDLSAFRNALDSIPAEERLDRKTLERSDPRPGKEASVYWTFDNTPFKLTPFEYGGGGE